MVFPAWAWIVFCAVLFSFLALDLYAHRGGRAMTRRGAVGWSALWVGVGLSFSLFVYFLFGHRPAQEYVAAYLIEESLSVDNLFVFLVLFESLRVPPAQHHHVLSWGIFGALVFRAAFIFAGATALARWDWLAYVFGSVLVIAAWRVFRKEPGAKRSSPIVGWLSRHFPVTHELQGPRFFVRENGARLATPLFLALCAVELTDILFAVDSVPAALSITRVPFLVYTSNAFAILGLRALYVVLAQTISELRYLHYGLAAVLAFAGIKLLGESLVTIPPLLSIGIILGCIGLAVAASLRK